MPGNYFDRYDHLRTTPSVTTADPAAPYRAPQAAANVEQTQADIEIKRKQLSIDEQRNAREADKAAQEKQTASGKVDQIYSGSLAKIDQQTKRIDELLKHPGLPLVIGPAQGRLPTLVNTAIGGVENLFGEKVKGSDAGDAQAFIDQIGSAATIAELQDIRANSPTGGALGQISNYEDDMLRKAAARLTQSQSEPAFKQALKDYREELQASKRRLGDAYKTDFGSPPPDFAPADDGWKIEPAN